jgi:hypothetical protein
MGSINEIMARTVAQTDPHSIKQMIADMIKEADEVMGGKLDKDKLNFMGNWLYKWLNERFGYLPMHHVKAAITFGAMGERGGTASLTPRNINLWLRAQSDIHQELLARQSKFEDEKTRNDNFNANKAEWPIAAAVRIKVTWLGQKLITSEEYDSFSSKAIYDLIKAGVPQGRIFPKDVVPNWELHRQEK